MSIIIAIGHMPGPGVHRSVTEPSAGAMKRAFPGRPGSVTWKLFLLCVGIPMPHSCPPPPWSMPLLLLWAVGRHSQFRHGPAAALSLTHTHSLSLAFIAAALHALGRGAWASKSAARGWGRAGLGQGSVRRGRRSPWAAGGARRMRSWIRGGRRRLRAGSGGKLHFAAVHTGYFTQSQ